MTICPVCSNPRSSDPDRECEGCEAVRIVHGIQNALLFIGIAVLVVILVVILK